jgi:hypothetical protein
MSRSLCARADQQRQTIHCGSTCEEEVRQLQEKKRCLLAPNVEYLIAVWLRKVVVAAAA